MPKPSRKKLARTRHPPTPPREVDGSSSPLLQALIAAKRKGTARAEQRYGLLKERLDRLQDPDTPWPERLQLIEKLERKGWAQYEDWPRLKRRFKYGGREWRIPISRDQLAQLDALEDAQDWKAYSDFLAKIIREHFQQHPELSERILADIESLHYFGAWVACQLWGRDERYSQWLMEKIVSKALGRIGARNLPALFRHTLPKKHTKEDLRQAAYLHLISKVILPHVHLVKGRLDAYWRGCVNKYVLTELRRERRIHQLKRKIYCPVCGGEKGVPPFVCSRCGTGIPLGPGSEPRFVALDGLKSVGEMGDILTKLTLQEFRSALTSRQQQVVELQADGKTEAEIATALRVSERTIQREVQAIRQQADELLFRR